LDLIVGGNKQATSLRPCKAGATPENEIEIRCNPRNQ
jgi:hypothetical protein